MAYIPAISSAASARPRLLIVGNGMATGRLLDELLKRDAARYDITVVGDEVQGSYNRIMLSPVLAAETTVAAIVQKDAAWYSARGIHFLAGMRVASLHPESRSVTLACGDSLHYDALVIAVGSRPARIPATGQSLANVFSFRTIADVESISARSGEARSAVVVGGGLLGLEAAYGLAVKGLAVTVVHRGEGLLNRQLDQDAGDYLRALLEAKGIQFRLGTEVEAFLGDAAVQSAQLKSGEVLACDLAVIATGITPNKELAEAAGFACGRAIQVDDYLCTSVPNVYALGECCEHRGDTFGLVEPIWQQCQTLADRLCGMPARPFRNTEVATKLKVSGVQVFSAGECHTRPGQRELVLRDVNHRVYRKLILQEDRIVGIVLLGDTRGGAEYFSLLQARVAVVDHLPTLILGKAFIPSAPVAASENAEEQAA